MHTFAFCKSLYFCLAQQRGPETPALEHMCCPPEQDPHLSCPACHPGRLLPPQPHVSRVAVPGFPVWRLLLETGLVFRDTRATAINSRNKNHLVFWALTFCSFCGNAADTSVFLVAKLLSIHLEVIHFIGALNTWTSYICLQDK